MGRVWRITVGGSPPSSDPMKLLTFDIPALFIKIEIFLFGNLFSIWLNALVTSPAFATSHLRKVKFELSSSTFDLDSPTTSISGYLTNSVTIPRPKNKSNESCLMCARL